MSGEKKQGFGKIASGVLLVLLILGLVGFGATDFGGATRSIGTVGDEEIDVNDYARALQGAIRNVEQRSGQNLTFLQADLIGVPAQVRAQLLADAALDNKLREIGISVGDDEVRRQILEYPSFQGADGDFDREAYRFTLENNGLNESAFEEQIRKETSRAILQNAVIGGIVPSAQLVETLHNFRAARRSYNLITLTEVDLEEVPSEPSQTALQAYYEENAAVFTIPEAREIAFAWLTPDMVVDQVEVDEAILREIYEQRIEEYVQPERRLVERLIFPDQSAAEDAAARLDSGEVTFDELVSERGLELSNVDLGDVRIDDLGAAGSAVFGLAEPGVTGPHATDLGPALFRMNAVLAAQETPFEEARDDLATEASQDQAARIIADMIVDIDDRLAAGATIEDLATETEMKLGEIAYYEGVTEGIAAYEAFRENAAIIRESDFPEIVTLDDGGIFAARLDGIAPPRLQPLDDVREEAVAGWRKAELLEQLQAKAETVKADLEAGKNAISVGYPVELFEGLTRTGVSPVELGNPLFEAELGDVIISAGDGQVYVAQLKEILPPDETDQSTAMLRQLWSQQSVQSLSQDLFSLFSQALLDEAGLTLNQTAIDAVHTQFLQ